MGEDSRHDSGEERRRSPRRARTLRLAGIPLAGASLLVGAAHAAPGTTVDVAIGGDTMFGRHFLEPSEAGAPPHATVDPANPTSFRDVVSPIAPLTQAADLMVLNFETSMTSATFVHPTKSIILNSPPASLGALAAMGVDLANVANNHVYDFLDQGLKDELSAFQSSSLPTVGAGDGTTAYQTVTMTKGGLKFGFASFCDVTERAPDSQPNQPPYLDAEGTKLGVAALTEANIDAAVSALRKTVDYVVVVLHGGVEYTTTPASDIATMGHRAIDEGADLVVASHPHVLQAIETYKGKPLAYSMGNFFFDEDLDETVTTALLHARFGGATPAFSIDPLFMQGFVPLPASGRIGRYVVRHLGELSARLGTTVVESGSGGEILPSAGSALAHTDQALVANAAPVNANDATGTVIDLETALGPLEYLESASTQTPAGATTWVGRDVLHVGSFEADLSGYPFVPPAGWYATAGAMSVTASNPEDGSLSMQLCSAGATPAVAAPRTRHRLRSDAAYSLCGCTRGDAGATASPTLDYYDSLSTSASSLGSTGMPGTTSTAWQCFCADAPVPAGALYAGVTLGVASSDGSTACAAFDDLRLVEWESVVKSSSLTVPNDYDFLRVTGNGSATPVVDYTIRTLELP